MPRQHNVFSSRRLEPSTALRCGALRPSLPQHVAPMRISAVANRVYVEWWMPNAEEG